MEMQERPRVYNKTSNAKINCSKSVAFPLHGDKRLGQNEVKVKNYVTSELKMK